MNQDAYNQAIRRLGAKEYSSGELNAYLERKGHTPEECAEVIARLIELNLVDDTRYTRAMVRYQASRGKGPQYIRMKLMQKGVSIGVPEIKQILGEVSDRTEVQTAREIVDRKFPNHKSDRDVRNKAIQTLMRRGFSYDVAKQALAPSGSEQDSE